MATLVAVLSLTMTIMVSTSFNVRGWGTSKNISTPEPSTWFSFVRVTLSSK